MKNYIDYLKEQVNRGMMAPDDFIYHRGENKKFKKLHQWIPVINTKFI